MTSQAESVTQDLSWQFDSTAGKTEAIGIGVAVVASVAPDLWEREAVFHINQASDVSDTVKALNADAMAYRKAESLLRAQHPRVDLGAERTLQRAIAADATKAQTLEARSPHYGTLQGVEFGATMLGQAALAAFAGAVIVNRTRRAIHRLRSRREVGQSNGASTV